MNRNHHDKEAFDDFYREHAVTAFAIARRRLPAHVAEEVVAEAFFLAWKKGAYQYEYQRARAWLLTVIYNLYRNVARKTSHEYVSEPSELQVVGEMRDPGGNNATEQTDLVNELDDPQYDYAWAALSAPDREVLALTYHDELRSEEIEVILGISSIALRTRLSRARSRFRSHYEKLSHANSLTQVEKP